MRKIQRCLVTLISLSPLCYSFLSHRTFQSRKPHTCSHVNVHIHSQTLAAAVESDNDDNKDNDEDTYDSLWLMDNADSDRQFLGFKTKEILNQSMSERWEPEQFLDAADVINSWSNLKTRRSPLWAEKILRRIIEERMAGNRGPESLDTNAMYIAILRAWSTSFMNGAPQRAEEILDNMQDKFEAGDPSMKPGIEAFNLVIDAYAYTKRTDATEQVVRVIQKLESLRQKGRTDVGPNLQSWCGLLNAIASSANDDAPALVKNVLDRMHELADTGYDTVKPTYECYNIYLSSIRNAITRHRLDPNSGAALADNFVREMMRSEDEEMRPDTQSFNIAISAWSKSADWNKVSKAESLVRTLEQYHLDCGRSDKTKPTTKTYNCLISCYCKSAMRDKARRSLQVLHRMEKAANVTANSTSAPDVVTYNIVMNTLAKSREPNAPIIVEELLHRMTRKRDAAGVPSCRPNSRSFNMCVEAWSKSNNPQAVERIREWIKFMEEQGDRGHQRACPNKWTYTAYLQALAHTQKREIADEACRILDQMEQESKKRGRASLAPDTMTFNHVIRCISMSGRADALGMAKQILSRMEDLHVSGNWNAKPNEYTYNYLIKAAAKSTDPRKALIALGILRKLQDVALRPSIMSYNLVLNACCFADRHHEPRTTLKIALDMLAEARKVVGANYITYNTAIRVVLAFEVDPAERWRIASDMLRDCCDDGQVTKSFLNQVRLCVSPEQYDLVSKKVLDAQNGRIWDAFSKNADPQRRT